MSEKIKSIDPFGSNTIKSDVKDKEGESNKVIAFEEGSIEQSKSTYDKYFKQLFTKKEFLSPILKNIIPEYLECPLEVIEDLIAPRGDEVVNPSVYSSEDSGKGKETTTHYDVLIDCALPCGGEVCVDLFFDLEMQRKNTPGYSIPKRGVYYCCRLISRQIDVLGDKAYDKLKPVYSVWILVNDIPEELKNSVQSVDLASSFLDKKFDNSEKVKQIRKDIDLIHLRLIYLSEDLNIEEGQSDLIKYLQSVFANKVLDKDCNPYHEHSKKIEEEVNAMLSAADEIEIRARQEGRAEENAKVFRDNVRRMFSKGVAIENIAIFLGSTIEEVNDVLSDTSEDSFEDAKLFK